MRLSDNDIYGYKLYDQSDYIFNITYFYEYHNSLKKYYESKYNEINDWQIGLKKHHRISSTRNKSPYLIKPNPPNSTKFINENKLLKIYENNQLKINENNQLKINGNEKYHESIKQLHQNQINKL